MPEISWESNLLGLPLHGSYELVLRGRAYADVTPQLNDELTRLREGGLKTLVVNAEGLEQIDSSGLNAFVQLLKQLRPAGGAIRFFGLSANIQRVFEITKLHRVMSVCASRDEALQGLQ